MTVVYQDASPKRYSVKVSTVPLTLGAGIVEIKLTCTRDSSWTSLAGIVATISLLNPDGSLNTSVDVYGGSLTRHGQLITVSVIEAIDQAGFAPGTYSAKIDVKQAVTSAVTVEKL